MKNKAYRHGAVNAQIEVDLPFQIRALRKQRGWTQPELAVKAEMKQPRISNMEKPGATRFTLETLRRLAEAFDVALVVRFAPFGELLDWSERFSPDDFRVASFDEELSDLEMAAPTPAQKVELALRNLLVVNIGDCKAKKEREQSLEAMASPTGNNTQMGAAERGASGTAPTAEDEPLKFPPQTQTFLAAGAAQQAAQQAAQPWNY